MFDWKNKKVLEETIAKSNCIADTLRNLGLNPNGSNPKTLKKYIDKYSIDISHFDASEARKRKPK